MEKRNIVVKITHIHCQHSTSESGDDEVYVETRTSGGDYTRYFFDNPLKMRGEKHGSNSNVDIEDIEVSYENWVDVELRERDSDTDTVSLGSFKINRDSKIEDTVRIYQPSGDKEGVYDVSYRIIDKPIPTIRLLGIKCEHNSDSCYTDLADTVATVTESVATECAKVLAKNSRPSRELMANGFNMASEIIGESAALVKWMANALEGFDDIYMQHTDPENPNTEGSQIFPVDAKNYKMETGDSIFFEEQFGEYYRVPLDKGDVTIQLREDDPHKKDSCIGAITIKEEDYKRLRSQGAQIEMAADYFTDKDNRQGAIYHICYSVGIEDWSKDANSKAQTGVGTLGEPPEEGVYYKIVNQRSNRALYIHKEDGDGGILMQSYNTEYSNSRWRVKYVDGDFQLINDYSGLCAGIKENENQNNDYIRQFEPSNSSTKLWSLEGGGDGFFYILNRKTDNALSVEGESKDVEANIVQYDQREMKWAAQKWKFVRTSKQYTEE